MQSDSQTEKDQPASLQPLVRRQCLDWHDHDWKEEYYGTRCAKCDLFFAHGQAPWDPVTEEHDEFIEY